MSVTRYILFSAAGNHETTPSSSTAFPINFAREKWQDARMQHKVRWSDAARPGHPDGGSPIFPLHVAHPCEWRMMPSKPAHPYPTLSRNETAMPITARVVS